jgi:hypothetical protein
MLYRRRRSDRYELPSLVVGVILILSAVALKLVSPVEDWLVLALAVLGGVLIPQSRVIEALRVIWRRNGEAN